MTHISHDWSGWWRMLTARGAQVLNVFKLARPANARRMIPVLILNPPRDSLVMRDEIFGPILPILGYRNIDDALETIRSSSCPLALYYFGADDDRARRASTALLRAA